MLPAVVIAKKRDSQTLSDDEITSFIDGYADGTIADYQMSAMAMAILLRGMNPTEIAALTRAMLDSGDRLPRNPSDPPRVDKHSTGGLGDKISLILAPLLACCNVQVPMISGRGLGLSGGTLDKLEAIPGFTCDLPEDKARTILTDVGCHIIGASERIAPADRRLYALRDVTGTVESVALITASILSKKLAASLDSLVMDVKVGSGAFMKDMDQAQALATSLVNTGKTMGLPVTALLTDMDQPLGVAVGNANEVQESLNVLRGDGPAEVRELTLQLCAQPLVMSGALDSESVAKKKLESHLDSGAAMECFERMIAAQGGRLNELPALAPKQPILADATGYVHMLDSMAIGECVVEMGGGRRKKGDAIDPTVGVDVLVQVGDQVERGQELGYVYGSKSVTKDWPVRLPKAFKIEGSECEKNELVRMRVDS